MGDRFMPHFQPYRFRTGLVLLLAVTVYAAVTFLYRQVQSYPEPGQTDPVSLHEERIRQIAKALPAAPAVGYVTGIDNEKLFLNERSFRGVEHLAQYYLTQYTLAPVIVRNSPDLPLVVGNFLNTEQPDPERLREKRLVPVRDFGDGLILYRKEGRP